MEKILISGGTGLIGKHLSKKLKEKGYSVAVLSRTTNTDTENPTYAWNIGRKEIEKAALESADYIIHLAGENLGDKRWTAKRKQQIIDSRVMSAELIYDNIKDMPTMPKAFISASAIGFYGAVTSVKIFDESDEPAGDFLGDTCRLWEQAADRFEKSGIRTVKIRTGVVLTKRGGALAKLLIPIKMGFGSALGSGKQYMPWIHIDDLCSIYVKAIEDTQMKGAYNAVAPEHRTNKEFTQALALILNAPLWFPNIPAIALKLFFGEMSVMLLKGSRVSSAKIIKAGFDFKYPALHNALTDLLIKK